MNKTFNLMFGLALFLFLLPFAAASASFDVQVKGLSVTSNTSISAMAGDTIPLALIFSVDQVSNDIIAKAKLNYSNGKTEVSSQPFDILDNSTYILDGNRALYLGIPADISESNEHATITLTLEDEDGDVLSISGFQYQKTVNILIQRESNKLAIKSIALPDVLNSGESALITTVIKNIGSNSQDNVYAEARITALGIISKRLVGYISHENGSNEISVELPVILPEQVKAGVYTVSIRAFNDKISAEQTVDVRINGVNDEVLLSDITPLQSIQEIEIGKRATYKITIINLGTTEQSYHLFVKDTQDWGTVQVTPSVLTLGRDKSATVEVYVAPKEDAKGVQRFQIVVESEGETVKQIDLVADIRKAQTTTNTPTTTFTQLTGLNISNTGLVGIAIIVFFLLLMIMAFRIRRIYRIKMKAIEAISQAKEMGRDSEREAAKSEAVDLVTSILDKVLEAKDKHLEVAKERAAGRAQNVIENLREDEIEEVFNSAVQKLGEKKTEGMNEKDRAGVYDKIKDHSHDIIEKITHKLSEKELDDVVDNVSGKLSEQEVEETGVDKTIETLTKLRDKIGDHIERLKVVEEEEVSGKVKKSKSRRKAKKKGKKAKKKLKSKKKSKKAKKKKLKGKKIKRKRGTSVRKAKKAPKKAKRQKRKIKKKTPKRAKRKTKRLMSNTANISENPVLEKIVTKEVTRKF